MRDFNKSAYTSKDLLVAAYFLSNHGKLVYLPQHKLIHLIKSVNAKVQNAFAQKLPRKNIRKERKDLLFSELNAITIPNAEITDTNTYRVALIQLVDKNFVLSHENKEKIFALSDRDFHNLLIRQANRILQSVAPAHNNVRKSSLPFGYKTLKNAIQVYRTNNISKHANTKPDLSREASVTSAASVRSAHTLVTIDGQKSPPANADKAMEDFAAQLAQQFPKALRRQEEARQALKDYQQQLQNPHDDPGMQESLLKFIAKHGRAANQEEIIKLEAYRQQLQNPHDDPCVQENLLKFIEENGRAANQEETREIEATHEWAGNALACARESLRPPSPPTIEQDAASPTVVGPSAPNNPDSGSSSDESHPQTPGSLSATSSDEECITPLHTSPRAPNPPFHGFAHRVDPKNDPANKEAENAFKVVPSGKVRPIIGSPKRRSGSDAGSEDSSWASYVSSSGSRKGDHTH